MRIYKTNFFFAFEKYWLIVFAFEKYRLTLCAFDKYRLTVFFLVSFFWKVPAYRFTEVTSYFLEEVPVYSTELRVFLYWVTGTEVTFQSTGAQH